MSHIIHDNLSFPINIPLSLTRTFADIKRKFTPQSTIIVTGNLGTTIWCPKKKKKKQDSVIECTFFL